MKITEETLKSVTPSVGKNKGKLNTYQMRVLGIIKSGDKSKVIGEEIDELALSYLLELKDTPPKERQSVYCQWIHNRNPGRRATKAYKKTSRKLSKAAREAQGLEREGLSEWKRIRDPWEKDIRSDKERYPLLEAKQLIEAGAEILKDEFAGIEGDEAYLDASRRMLHLFDRSNFTQPN